MDEVDAGDLLIAFDSRVLELFNTMDGTSKRYHVRRFALTLEGPDDKGRLGATSSPGWAVARAVSASMGLRSRPLSSCSRG
jgi:hypothetical protein